MKAYLELQEWWLATGTDIGWETVTEARLIALEDRYRIQLPADFREYLHHSSPNAAWDEHLSTWWGVELIKNIPDELSYEVGPLISDKGQKYLFFVDHCIWSWAWAISCAEDETYGKVALIAEFANDRFVADNFSEFVHTYVTNWEALIP